MNFWKKIFDHVSKFLHSNAQPMPGCLAAVPDCVAVQFVGFSPAIQRNTLKGATSGAYAAGTDGKRPGPGPPLLCVELLKRLCGLCLKRLLPAPGIVQELLGNLIIRRAKLHDPF